MANARVPFVQLSVSSSQDMSEAATSNHEQPSSSSLQQIPEVAASGQEHGHTPAGIAVEEESHGRGDNNMGEHHTKSEGIDGWRKVHGAVASNAAMVQVLNEVRTKQIEKMYDDDWNPGKDTQIDSPYEDTSNSLTTSCNDGLTPVFDGWRKVHGAVASNAAMVQVLNEVRTKQIEKMYDDDWNPEKDTQTDFLYEGNREASPGRKDSDIGEGYTKSEESDGWPTARKGDGAVASTTAM